MEVIIDIIVTEDFIDSRLDRFVRFVCKPIKFSLVQKLIRTKKIKVNGKKVKADYILLKNDIVSIYDNSIKGLVGKESSKNESERYDPKLEQLYKEMLIFENDDFIALNKKPGLAVQLGSKLDFCIENILKNALDQYYLVHRLDKNTSGVLLVAKHKTSARTLTSLFKDGKIKKTYWAIVDGKINKSGVIKNIIGKTFVAGQERMSVVKDGQIAITNYKPLQRVGYYTLLELKPDTGRKHQLRVHCAEELHAPILGDNKYNKNVQHKKLFLHSKKLEIADLNVTIEAELPEYFKKFLDHQQ